MGIELKIVADNVGDLHDQLGHLLTGLDRQNFVVPSGAIEEEPKAEPPKKQTRTRKAEPAPAATDEAPAESGNSESSSTSTTSTTATTPASPSEDEPQVQYGDVQKAVTGLAAAKGRDAVMKVYDNFGVDHATKLKPEQWVDVIAELDAAREAA